MIEVIVFTVLVFGAGSFITKDIPQPSWEQLDRIQVHKVERVPTMCPDIIGQVINR